ncbi:MAG: hypothetical protein AAFY28_06820, partial [Actinomycetota bacterium]
MESDRRIGSLTRLLATGVALACIAAACVDEDSQDGSSAPTSSGQAEEPAATDDASAPTTTDDASDTTDQGDEPDTTNDVSETTAPASPPSSDAPLTASDIGVTASTITIGIPALDVEQLREFGILTDAEEFDDIAAWESAVANVNERGGINGRTLEAVYATFLPLGQAQSDAACVELVEDNEIFAAVGSLIVPEGVLCYAELNGTPFVGAVGTIPTEILERSSEPVLATSSTTESLQRAMIQFAESEGVLERPIAVHGDDQSAIEAATRELESRGANVVSVTLVSAPETDQAARLAEFEQIFERWRSDGAEVVINVGTTLDVLSAMGRQEFYIDVYSADESARQYQPTE